MMKLIYLDSASATMSTMHFTNFIHKQIMQLDIDKARVNWLLQGNRGRKKIEKDPNAEDKEKPYVCEGWNSVKMICCF